MENEKVYASTVRCPICRNKVLDAYKQDGVLAGLFQNKCRRCRTVTTYLLLQEKVYIVDDKLDTPKRLQKIIKEFENKLPKDRKSLIMKELSETIFIEKKS